MTNDRPATSGFLAPRSGAREFTDLDTEVVELTLLRPRWQAEALEEVAHTRGLTAAQMLRKLVGLAVRGPEPARA